MNFDWCVNYDGQRFISNQNYMGNAYPHYWMGFSVDSSYGNKRGRLKNWDAI